ncbi:Uncharacterized protein PECH_005829 [Penicillium ucsense]|uniref:Uncharacterized protein n=1 Tax=Penicillium ucsense TaxID=2839758 RepID=A0A8J8VXY5_9EURO|nr:Uncharacterized protein PECM_000555 [Penicillium ucsense]KAF7736131.1 Uncharacterized protein PECH_005829 [Penicillium ucsense]
MRKPLLSQAVHEILFPRQRHGDPGSFTAHVTRNLVPEVRIETNQFYGPLDCIEAQYPGLDYAHPPHRLRLSRFPWHRRLFRAFDELKLTEEEISELCCWEGTKSARQRYELEKNIRVRDTTGDTVRRATAAPSPTVTLHPHFYTLTEESDEEDYLDAFIETRSEDTVRASTSRASSVTSNVHNSLGDEEYSDDEMESCGVALNHRLMAATAARARGADVPLDEDYEQWLKDVNERGGYEWMVAAIRTNQPVDNPEAAASSPLDSISPHTELRGWERRGEEEAVLADQETRPLSASEPSITSNGLYAHAIEPLRVQSAELEHGLGPRNHYNWGGLFADNERNGNPAPQHHQSQGSNTAR